MSHTPELFTTFEHQLHKNYNWKLFVFLQAKTQLYICYNKFMKYYESHSPELFTTFKRVRVNKVSCGDTGS